MTKLTSLKISASNAIEKKMEPKALQTLTTTSMLLMASPSIKILGLLLRLAKMEIIISGTRIQRVD